MISVSNNTLMLHMLIVIFVFQRGILPVGQNRVSSSVERPRFVATANRYWSVFLYPTKQTDFICLFILYVFKKEFLIKEKKHSMLFCIGPISLNGSRQIMRLSALSTGRLWYGMIRLAIIPIIKKHCCLSRYFFGRSSHIGNFTTSSFHRSSGNSWCLNRNSECIFTLHSPSEVFYCFICWSIIVNL